jgi:diacylglycerol kinase family enzyme
VDAVTILNRGKAHGANVGSALRSAGIDGPVDLVDGGSISERARAAVEQGAKLVVIGGGDGSVGAAAAAVADTGTRLGILPLGTLNHFARDLGIPLDLDGAAALIATGSEHRVDIAEMNGRAFVNNSAVGLYPLMVVDRDAQRHRLGRSKRLAMAVASVRTLARFGHQRLTLTVNDQKAQIDTPLLFVGNNDYRLEMPGAGRRDTLDGGELCVLVMRSKTRAGFLAATLRALLGRARHQDMVRLEQVERLGVDSGRSRLTMSLDGEVLRVEPPLDYRIRKRALRVIAPGKTAEA